MYKDREIYDSIENHLPQKEFAIITGARQTGKTMLLQQIYRNLKATDKNSFIKRDIVDSKVENEQLFYNLMVLLAMQSGNLLNKNAISMTLGDETC
ncbi:MAG: AAA family ATPase [Chlorobi bacterium]|nr:AAA family ATPase [Chlorobiota bacterium]